MCFLYLFCFRLQSYNILLEYAQYLLTFFCFFFDLAINKLVVGAGKRKNV